MEQGTNTIDHRQQLNTDEKYEKMARQLQKLGRDYVELARQKKNTDRRLRRAMKAKTKRADACMGEFIPISDFHRTTDSGHKAFLGTESVAKEKDESTKNYNDAPRKGGVKGRETTCWNVTSDKVTIVLPGSKRSRINENGAYIGGAASNEKNLLAKVICFCKSGLASIKDIARNMARELSLIAEDVRVMGRNKMGGHRKVWENAKPAEVLGEVHKDTLSRAVHAFNLAIDKKVVEIIGGADLIFLSVDASTFGMNSMQSTYWAAYKIVTLGIDAAGNALMEIEFNSGFLNALPVENKGTVTCRDQNGKEMHIYAPEKFALTLRMSGIAVLVKRHRCLTMGFDGGGEACGSGTKIDTLCHSGKGGYIHHCFITRKAFGEAECGHEGILAVLDDFYGVSEEDLLELKERPAPKRLRTDRAVLTLDGKRVSMQRNPLRYFALILGGIPRTRYCNKHRVNLAFLLVMKVMTAYLKDLLSVVLFFRNVWVLMKLKPTIQGIFDMPGSRPTRFLTDAAAKIPADIHERARSRLLRFGFKMLREAAKTRWNTVQEGAKEIHNRWPELVAAMPLAMGRGTDQARLDTVEAVLSEKGFREKNMIVFSPKEGKNFWRMNDPAFRWGNMLVKFFQVTVWGPIMAASSHNNESSLRSMGGVGSILRRILSFLQFSLFVHVPRHSLLPNPENDEGIQKRNARRELLYGYMDRCATCIPVAANRVKVPVPLAHRGVPIKENQEGYLMLNPHVERKVIVSKLPPKTESRMRHIYDRFHTPEMDTIISELIETIQTLSQVDPGDNRNFLPEGLQELVPGPQTTQSDKKRALLASVRVLSDMTIKAILQHHDRDLYDPHGFLCGLIDVGAIPALNNRNRESCKFMVSTHEARANAGILMLLIKELGASVKSQLSDGESLGDYLTGPFGAFFRSPLLLTELQNFIQGHTVPLPINVIEDRALEAGDRQKKQMIYGTCQPFTAYQTLAKQALIANAEPTNNSRVEGGHSLASGKWRALMRRATPRWWSATIRKKTMLNAGLEDYVNSEEFLQLFLAARRLSWKHSEALKNLWHLDLQAGADRSRARKADELPDYVRAGQPFNNSSNIAPPQDGSGGKRKKPIEPASRQGGAKGNKRHRDSDNSEFEDSDVEPDEQDSDHDLRSNQGGNTEDGDLELAEPEHDMYYSEQPESQGQDRNNQAQPPLQERRESDADSDDDFADIDLDEIEALAAASAAITTNLVLPSGSIAVVEPAPDDEECDFSIAELEAAEQAAGIAELQTILNRNADSDVSEDEGESQQHSI